MTFKVESLTVFIQIGSYLTLCQTSSS